MPLLRTIPYSEAELLLFARSMNARCNQVLLTLEEFPKSVAELQHCEHDLGLWVQRADDRIALASDTLALRVLLGVRYRADALREELWTAVRLLHGGDYG